jgi:hypothetical protein
MYAVFASALKNQQCSSLHEVPKCHTVDMHEEAERTTKNLNEDSKCVPFK